MARALADGERPDTVRVLHARVAALTRWSKSDPVEGTAKARKAFLDRFERDVGPEGILPPAERARRADLARRAYFAKLGMRSAMAKRNGKR